MIYIWWRSPSHRQDNEIIESYNLTVNNYISFYDPQDEQHRAPVWLNAIYQYFVLKILCAVFDGDVVNHVFLIFTDNDIETRNSCCLTVDGKTCVPILKMWSNVIRSIPNWFWKNNSLANKFGTHDGDLSQFTCQGILHEALGDKRGMILEMQQSGRNIPR